jgi:hypothetical protein
MAAIEGYVIRERKQIRIFSRHPIASLDRHQKPHGE